MPQYKGNFRCVVLSAKRLVFEDEINSLFITGDRGEYEILAYHYPLIGIVKGDIVINWEKRLSVKGGVVRFFANECNIMIEEAPPMKTNGD
jgi:F0F1-type ATP synthase epsilon subunit